MCRIFGCVARQPVSIRPELLTAENPLIRQSEEHDSGWGMAVYTRPDAGEPRLVRFPTPAHAGEDFGQATELEGRIFNAHVRSASIGGLTLENTHPFVLAGYSFCHNGTILDFPKLLEDGVAPPIGQTDSEHLFNLLMRDYDPAHPVGSLRGAMLRAVRSGPLTGLNFLFSDGERLFAYKLGVHSLHWRAEPGRLLVSSEPVGGGFWHSVNDDVLLVLDPEDPEEPHAERLVGDAELAGARIVPEEGKGLRGDERGAFAAERAARLSALRH
jgi:predicted glutamine amidotransferase